MWHVVLVIGCWRFVPIGTSTVPLGVAVNRSGEDNVVGADLRTAAELGPTSAAPPVSGHRTSSHRTLAHLSSTSPPPQPPDSDEYYSSYAEYPEAVASAFNVTGYERREGQVEEEEVHLPDDSLADTDLHDHDLIDSVMYIYFGANSRDQTGAGRQVLIVGAVIALVAQFLTLASGLKRITSQRQEPALLILLNTELALTLTNLVFMLGVQATGDTSQCEMVAVSLHYLHLVVCCWLFATSLHLYRRLTLDNYRPTVWLYALAAWTAPALLVYVCTKLNRDGYESHDYCWMSVEKGMLFSFMIPVSVLMLGNTVLAVLGLRLASHWKEESVERKWVRVSATLLPLFAVVWFLGVVALENSASLVFPLLFLASNGFLNWFVFICWLPTDISAWHESEEDFDEEEEELFEEHHQQHQQQVMQAQKQGGQLHHSPEDHQQLLQEVYVCGRRHHYDLQMDPICTISS